jgi:translation initiation factor 2 subunit 2
MDYQEMLERGKKALPETATATERFSVPKVTGHLEGNKTVISNFFQVSSILRRTPEHLLKYITRETAAKGELKKQLLIFNTKIPSSKLNEKLQQYVDEFVICKECGKPDTKIYKEGIVTYIKCQACGARHPIHSKI